MRTVRASVLFVVVLGTCAASAPKKTLFERLGSGKGVRAVVDDFVANAAADPRIGAYFVPTAADPKRLNDFKRNLANQICQASGGPCKYTGKTMREAHAHMGITDAQFDAMVQDLEKSLDKFKVPKGDKGRLLGILGPMRKDIVEKPAGSTSAAAAPSAPATH